MPSVTYMNQSAPFWDFIANLEQQGSQHPGENRDDDADHERERAGPEGPQDPFAPWNWGHQFFGGGMPHRGGPPHRRHEHQHQEPTREKDAEMNDSSDNGEGPSGSAGSDNEAHGEDRPHGRGGPHGRHGGGPRGRCGPGGWGGFGPRHGPDPHHGHHHGGRRKGWGPWGRGGPFGGMGGGPSGFGGNTFDPSTLVTQLFNQFNAAHPSNASTNTNYTTKANESEDHTPEADIFDTESAYVVHVSLPGAKKEDVGVNWNTEKSELSVAGVIYRPGDEEFLRTLAMNERKVGAFERKIRLGTRANPASIDADSITAKLEDGVLRVEVPKLDSGYVEIRKVDIE